MSKRKIKAHLLVIITAMILMLFGIAPVSASAKVTVSKTSVLKKNMNTTYRYNVLILDASKNMSGNPNKTQKLAAKRFCQKILSAKGNNYVAVITLNASPKTVCNFTNNYKTLEKCINAVSSHGNSNINQALSTAGKLLDKVSAKGKTVMKNIILCSNGLPTSGVSAPSGRYKSSDHKRYKYANAAYTTASKLKKKNYSIYALGFFHKSSGKDLTFGKRLMKDLASKDKYCVIQNASQVDTVFDTIAGGITKAAMNKSSLTLKVKNTYQLYALANGVKKTASWKSSNSSIVSVNKSGKITAKKAGTATITATVNGQSVKCKVTVKSASKVSLKLNKSKVTLYVGEKLLLKASAKRTKKKVKWKSSNSSVAAVNSSGVITGKKAGNAVISATAGGVTAKCTVTVKKASHPLYSMYFNFPRTKHGKTKKYIDEVGIRIVLNKNAVIEKCGAYMRKSGNYWYCTLAFKGKNVKSATMSSYLSNNGKTVYDSMTSKQLNKFPMSKNSKGIWSIYGSFQTIRFNVFDTAGKNVANIAPGKQSENTEIFTNLNTMKKWLAK